jgi:hypothetical protein
VLATLQAIGAAVGPQRPERQHDVLASELIQSHRLPVQFRGGEIQRGGRFFAVPAFYGHRQRAQIEGRFAGRHHHLAGQGGEDIPGLVERLKLVLGIGLGDRNF